MAHAMKRSAAIMIAAGIALPGAVSTAIVLSAPAFAQEQSTIGNEPGTLTIHKRLNPDSIGGPGTGAPVENAPGQPMPGVSFTATRIDFDMTTAEGFRDAARIKPAEAAKKLTSESFTQTTDANGDAVFADLPVGAYYVVENPTEAQLANGLVPAAPFVAYVPMTTDGKWNRDVHVYPKNTELTTEKTVDDANKHPGDDNAQDVSKTLSYTVKSTVPVLPENRTLTKYRIVDSYNNKELTNVKIAKVTVADQELKEGVDYTVTTGTAAAKEGSDANATVTVELSEARVKALKADDEFAVTLTGDLTKIGEDAIADGAVVNRGRTTGETEVTGNPGFNTTTFETPDDEVTSYFGAVQVIKTGENDAKLEGAVFDLYKVPSQAEGACNDRSNQQIIRTGITTDGNGTAVINGLHVTDIQNNDEQITDTYCLVETKAPKGYVKDETPRAFTLTQGEATSGQVINAVRIAKTLEVPNVAQPPLTLPGTGGSGVLALVALGLVIVGGGAYVARRNSVKAA